MNSESHTHTHTHTHTAQCRGEGICHVFFTAHSPPTALEEMCRGLFYNADVLTSCLSAPHHRGPSEERGLEWTCQGEKKKRQKERERERERDRDRRRNRAAAVGKDILRARQTSDAAQ